MIKIIISLNTVSTTDTLTNITKLVYVLLASCKFSNIISGVTNIRENRKLPLKIRK